MAPDVLPFFYIMIGRTITSDSLKFGVLGRWNIIGAPKLSKKHFEILYLTVCIFL
jgi:hypothetical protein